MVSQAEALREALETLNLGPEYGPLVAYCEGIAEIIDDHPERATLWREYRPALEALIAAGDSEVDDGQARLLELVRTPVRNGKKPRSGDAGPSGSGNRGNAGAAVDAVAGPRRRRRSGTAS